MPDLNQYCDGNIWSSDENNPYENTQSYTTGNIKYRELSCKYGTISGPGEINFAWMKNNNLNPAFYINYSFYVDDKLKSKCNNTEWRCVSLPIESGSHEIKWLLKLDSRVPSGRCPQFAEGTGWISNISFIRNGDNPTHKIYITPKEGSLNDSYIFNVSLENVPDFSDLILEIKNPHLNNWKSFGRGENNLDNITFKVPKLNFIKPPYLGIIEFRLKNGDNYIGPFEGPNIIINFGNKGIDHGFRTLSVEVISESCSQDICLYCNNNTFRETYTGCRSWQTVTFRDLNGIDGGSIGRIGVCNE